MSKTNGHVSEEWLMVAEASRLLDTEEAMLNGGEKDDFAQAFRAERQAAQEVH